jgi:hypothetical protein
VEVARRIAVLVALAACGRIGFDSELGSTDSGGDGSTGVQDGSLEDAPTVEGSWMPVTPAASVRHLYAAWAFGPNDVWIAGDGGEVRHFDGVGWADASIGVKAIYALWGATSNDVWEVGADCEVRRWNGTMWTTVTLQNCGGSDINAIDGTAADNMWLAGIGGQVYQYTGTFTLRPQANQAQFSGVWIVGNEAYICGSGGRMLHWNGSTMLDERITTTATLTSVWGSSANDVWTVASNGAIYRRVDAAPWVSVPSPTVQALYAVRGTAANNIWAVGAGGVALHYDGTSWQQVAMPTTEALRAIAVVPGGGMRIVGDAGTVLEHP